MSKLQYDVFQYLNLSAQDKLDFFMETRSELTVMADYWVNFEKVYDYARKFDSPEIYALDYLIGKSDDELIRFFQDYPQTFLLIPSLLGIREGKLKDRRFLVVQDLHSVYELDFKHYNPAQHKLYLQFLYDSGLAELLKSGLKKSVYDYNIGVESGMDSNARKNRSGKMGELYLENLLDSFADGETWKSYGQTKGKDVKANIGIELDETFENRQFDGSLYNTKRKKLYLMEVNNFNSGGSKSKASATEFIDLNRRLTRTNHEFIYITDGRGWDSDKSHLLEAMEHIGKVFNYRMVEDGFLENYLLNY